MPLRIKQLREKAGLKQHEVAQALGLHLTNYNKLENGKSELTLSRMQELAQLFGVRPEELISEMATPARTVPVTTTVEAGTWRQGSDIDGSWTKSIAVPDEPAWRGRRLYAAETRGDSMNRRYPNGSILVFVDYVDDGGKLQIGRSYVVQRERFGEIEQTCKTLIKGSDGRMWLAPDSTDPTFEAFPLSDDHADTELRVIGRVVWSARNEDSAVLHSIF